MSLYDDIDITPHRTVPPDIRVTSHISIYPGSCCSPLLLCYLHWRGVRTRSSSYPWRDLCIFILLYSYFYKGVASETPQSARSWISSRISHLITQIQRFSSLWRCGYQITWRKWRWGASPPCSPRPSPSTWRAARWRRHLLRTVGVVLPLQQTSQQQAVVL